DRFGNYEGLLPEGNYKECDIDTMNAKSRGAKRIVFSEDAIYYTEDHYETFVQLY
ncbi:MAG: ribonuclease, partial [Oscillospiraceae bacterium]|nr:ribonuclease [Oscillospiraceae bacterium]